MEHPNLRHLDISAFAARNGQAEHTSPLSDFPRLAAELASGVASADRAVHWRIAAELRRDAAGQPMPWLHCQARTTLALTCQRCLQPAETTVQSDQWFRFVATEAQAEQEDEDAEEDVLALQGPLNVLTLIEDDLLLALPPLVKHEACDSPAPLHSADAAFNAAGGETNRPFAQLAQLLTQPLEGAERKPRPNGHGGHGGEQAD
ncbi:DUF177 domain-containing protein [Allofranklinella schreckenbergeri]|uniref:Large ribosomal RNA subunit accumulation protein YceD n=1 Tax=Allofranklinella schreckenbergeri TaxID=1076744 RepID=A0A3M6R7S5_9BURK|nr:YceD family protein [Allofranklinella schreckenbergeri]RMX11353.1 DUF177 domain-containing protein [Allofranklinella schreckenbergeri]